MLGGTLADALSWRWIFFLNLPIAAFAAFVTWRVVPAEQLDDGHHRVDYGGVLTLSTGLFALLLALDVGIDLGWTNPRILGLFAVSALSLAAFAMVERRAGNNALVPADVRGNRAFLAAGIATLLMSAIFFAALLYLPQFMAKQLGYSAVGAGAGLLPMMATFALTSFIAGPLYARLGAKVICAAGALCLAAGMFLLSRMQPTTTYDELIPGMVVLGIGVGLFYSSITTAASLDDGIHVAFLLNVGLAVCGLAVCALFVGGRLDQEQLRTLRHRHRGHG